MSVTLPIPGLGCEDTSNLCGQGGLCVDYRSGAHRMGVDITDAFIVVRWPEGAGLPRYTFVTPPHLREVQTEVLQVQSCSSIAEAAAIVDRLNADASLSPDN